LWKSTAFGPAPLAVSLPESSLPEDGAEYLVPPESHCRIGPMGLDVPNPPSICLCVELSPKPDRHPPDRGSLPCGPRAYYAAQSMRHVPVLLIACLLGPWLLAGCGTMPAPPPSPRIVETNDGYYRDGRRFPGPGALFVERELVQGWVSAS
jgi:hypothetical protein